MNEKIKKKQKKRTSRNKKIIFSILSIFICIVIVGFVYFYNQLDKINTTKISEDNNDLGISDEIDIDLGEKEVVNIALFGIDSRRQDDDQLTMSDAIMILSIDEEHDKIKLISILRDSYVNVDEYGMTKLTHAYGYGGPELAIKTLNENYNLNIKDYATVDFFGLEKIIDTLGGVDIDVQEDEIPYINGYMMETSTIENKYRKEVTKPGFQTLNGMQAVAYARIRAIGDDFERTQRHRTVLNCLFEKIKNASIPTYATLLNDVLPCVETNLSKTKMLNLGTYILTNKITTLEQFRIPMDNDWYTLKLDGIDYLGYDLDLASNEIYDFIYNDKLPSDDTETTDETNETEIQDSSEN